MITEKFTIRQLRELGRRELSAPRAKEDKQQEYSEQGNQTDRNTFDKQENHFEENNVEEQMRMNYQVAALETDLLLSQAIGEERIYLELHSEEIVKPNFAERFIASLSERKQGRPIAYLLGHREFMGYDYFVEEGVLIPRSDTEVVVELATTAIRSSDAALGLEIGVGTGIISLSLLSNFPQLKMLGVDINEQAVLLAQKNALYLDNQHYDEDGIDYIIAERFDVFWSNLFSEVEQGPFSLDFIVSNPPYIDSAEMKNLMKDVLEYEPHSALFGGEDGLDFYREILEQGLDFVKAGGFVAFEMGFDQGDALYELMLQYELKNIQIAKDLAGHDRAIIGTK